MMMDNGEKKPCSYLVYELMPKGSLDKKIQVLGTFSEEICRYYFKQLLDGLKYLHSKGFAHRDIKTDNLLFDADFNIKIADFGTATKMEGSGKIEGAWGTEGFMAPELYELEQFDGRLADLFAAAVVLFKMFFGFMPFYTTNYRIYDKHAPMLMNSRWDDFWVSVSNHDGRTDVPEPSDQLKELFQKMLAWEVKDRLTIL